MHYFLIYTTALLCICVSIFSGAATTVEISKGHPCAEVKCYYNSICKVDPTTDAAICVCPENECDGGPEMTICAGGMTFKNPCHLQTYMCKAQKWLNVEHVGPCGELHCSAEKPCPFHGRCVLGTCSCVRCQNARDRRPYLEIVRPRRNSVCGSDGVRYDSECHLRLQSCLSRTPIFVGKRKTCRKERKSPVQRNAPIRSFSNHFLVWRQSDPLGEGGEADVPSESLDFSQGSCPKFEIYGCLPARHRRSVHLGIYTLVPGKTYLNSPIYVKYASYRNGISPAYLSRYNSSRFPEGAWVVGSKIGTGIGWFGVNDPSPDPQGITNSWQSTTGPTNRPWVAEPSISGRCVGAPKKKTTQACDLGQERGRLGINWQAAAQQTPLYELAIKRPREKFYRPGKKLVVEVFTNNLAKRFVSVHVSIENSVDACEPPEVSKVRHKFDFHCNNSVVSRTGRRMRKAAIHFTAPPRGCITFKALVKSEGGEVFYDNAERGSLAPTPLTKTICHIGFGGLA